METLIQNWPNLLLAFSIMSVGMFSPGPNILAVMGTSMSAGRASGSSLALGIGIGSGLWAFLTVLGFSALIAQFAYALTALKLFGAAYLLYLAYKAFKSAATTKEIAAIEAEATSRKTLFLRGLTIQMTNPKAALAWIATVALGIGPEAPFIVCVALIVGALVISIGGHMLYATLFSTQAVVRTYARIRRGIDATLGLFFCFASFKLLTTRT